MTLSFSACIPSQDCFYGKDKHKESVHYLVLTSDSTFEMMSKMKVDFHSSYEVFKFEGYYEKTDSFLAFGYHFEDKFQGKDTLERTKKGLKYYFGHEEILLKKSRCFPPSSSL